MVGVHAQIKAKISNADIQGKQVLSTFTPALNKNVKQAFANFMQHFCSKLELFFTWDFYKISTAPEELLQTSWNAMNQFGMQSYAGKSGFKRFVGSLVQILLEQVPYISLRRCTPRNSRIYRGDMHIDTHLIT